MCSLSHCGPVWSNGIASENARPVRTARDAAQHGVGRDEVERAALVVGAPPSPVRNACARARESSGVSGMGGRTSCSGCARWTRAPAGSRMPAETDRHERTLMAWPTESRMRRDRPVGRRRTRRRARGVRRDRAGDRARASRSRWSRRPPRRRRGRRTCAAPTSTWSRCRSTTRGSATTARSSCATADGDAARAALPVQRVGREVVAVGRRRGRRRGDRRRTSGSRCTRCRWCSRAARSRSTAPGSLVTTERCLLNPNRNPADGSRAEIEDDAAERLLGVERIVWLADAHRRGRRHRRSRRQRRRVHRAAAARCSRVATIPTNPNHAIAADNRAAAGGGRHRGGRGPGAALRDASGAAGCSRFPT